jgi:hypothetical protein
MGEDQGLVSSKDTPRSPTLFAAHSQKSYENVALCTKNIKQFKAKQSFVVYYFFIFRALRLKNFFAFLEKIFCSCAG